MTLCCKVNMMMFHTLQLYSLTILQREYCDITGDLIGKNCNGFTLQTFHISSKTPLLSEFLLLRVPYTFIEWRTLEGNAAFRTACPLSGDMVLFAKHILKMFCIMLLFI